ncbi:MAG TPA: DUF4349 domain-containing protein, partial [Candidatus Moranbacteria bacterium]|nr:DUF4349 domain-containing protein [Candidatus Moranbacteria bacterium]
MDFINLKVKFMNEKTKKWLKISGIVIGVLLLYGIFNLFFGGVSRRATYNFKEKPSRFLRETDSVKSPALDMSNSSNGLSSKIFVPAAKKSEVGSSVKSKKTSSENKESQDKRVIKNGNLSLKVAKTENAVKEISEIAKSKGGEVFSSRFYEGVKGSKNGMMTVKVP